VRDEEGKYLTLFLINRHPEESINVSYSLGGIATSGKASHLELAGFDLKAVNTARTPDAVKPVVSNGTKQSADGWASNLRPLSWNMIRIELA